MKSAALARRKAFLKSIDIGVTERPWRAAVKTFGFISENQLGRWEAVMATNKLSKLKQTDQLSHILYVHDKT